MMRIAASSICWAHDSLADALRKAHETGFEAVELLAMPKEVWDIHGDLREMKPQDLRRQLDGEGLVPAAMHLGAFMTSTPEVTRTQTDYAKLAVGFAKELGCSVLVETGPERDRGPLQPLLHALEEIVPLLDASDICLGLENHYGNALQFPDDYEDIFARFDSPNLGMTLDTGHFCAAGVDPAAVASRFGERIHHVHIKDHIGLQSVALGAGNIDNAAVVSALKDTGYRGYLSQELEVADTENADRYAREGLEYMRRLAAL